MNVVRLVSKICVCINRAKSREGHDESKLRGTIKSERSRSLIGL